jgi:hypothetical protein
MPRLTKPLLEAMLAALNAALAGEGFEGGDFDGLDRKHFERAQDWVFNRIVRRSAEKDDSTVVVPAPVKAEGR